VATSRARSWIRFAAPALIGAALVGSAADASAFSVKKTTKGELVHWDSRDVHYAIDPSVEANVTAGNAAVRQAMESWSGDVGAPTLHAENADATSPTKPGFDQKNGVFFIPGGYAPAGRALAITVLTYDNSSGKILDADVIFNGSYNFAVLGEGNVGDVTKLSSTDGISHTDEPTGDPATVYDLHHVIAHETGHSLGMNDEMERKDALMYRYTSPNDATLRQPASDDISGLAELYSSNLEAHGNGCGGATVAPKKPSLAAQHAAILGVLGLLFFLVLRARSDRRARLAFVLATATAAVAFLPSVSTKGGQAQASELEPGQARAKVFSTATTFENGLMKTTYKLATSVCRATSCPKTGQGVAWGGQIGNIRQDVGGQFAPTEGDDVDVSFAKLPNVLAPLTSPLPARDLATSDVDVRVLTAAAQ
jgi:hypothetical protein